MAKGKTRTGFNFSYNDKQLKSVRTLEALAKMDKGGNDAISGLSELLDLLLGADQKEKLYTHLEKIDPDGIATIDAIKDEIEDIFNQSGEEAKN